jgi:hypothetical protein
LQRRNRNQISPQSRGLGLFLISRTLKDKKQKVRHKKKLRQPKKKKETKIKRHHANPSFFSLVAVSRNMQEDPSTTTLGDFTSSKKDEINLSSLPRDIQLEILQFLEGKDLLSMCRVDWYWNTVASDDENIWRPLCRKRWSQIHLDLFKTWKSCWMSRNSRFPSPQNKNHAQQSP